MTYQTYQYVSFEEFCDSIQLPPETIFEIIEQGIVDPDGDTPENWTFDTNMITVTKKACRLHRDFGIDWSGIALAISLIDELEQVREENKQLRSRLKRFVAD
ncbi:MAG: chaperone modulatory protein CbpM [Oceanicoccus sp.]|jgi:chaperone modulatory protein CbpM